MFTTPCFIRKSTPELRRKLDELDTFHTQQQTLYITTEVGHCIPVVFSTAIYLPGRRKKTVKLLTAEQMKNSFLLLQH